jgi:hypothetical protein
MVKGLPSEKIKNLLKEKYLNQYEQLQHINDKAC